MTSSHSGHPAGKTMTMNRAFAGGFGVVYALVGLLGFAVSGAVPFAGEEGVSLLGFGVNGLHNIVHLLVGAVLIAGAAAGHAAARSANLAVGVVYLLLAVAGPFINDTALDVIGLNSADHLLHLATAVLLLAVALAGDKGTARR
jgi:hypothetical protein